MPAPFLRAPALARLRRRTGQHRARKGNEKHPSPRSPGGLGGVLESHRTGGTARTTPIASREPYPPTGALERRLAAALAAKADVRACGMAISPRDQAHQVERPARAVVTGICLLEGAQGVPGAVDRPGGEQTIVGILEGATASYGDEPRVAPLGEDDAWTPARSFAPSTSAVPTRTTASQVPALTAGYGRRRPPRPALPDQHTPPAGVSDLLHSRPTRRVHIQSRAGS